MGEGVDISWRNTFNISIRKGSKRSCTIWKVTKRVKSLVAWVKTRSTILKKVYSVPFIDWYRHFGFLFIDIIYKLLNDNKDVIYLYSLCGSRKYTCLPQRCSFEIPRGRSRKPTLTLRKTTYGAKLEILGSGRV